MEIKRGCKSILCVIKWFYDWRKGPHKIMNSSWFCQEPVTSVDFSRTSGITITGVLVVLESWLVPHSPPPPCCKCRIFCQENSMSSSGMQLLLLLGVKKTKGGPWYQLWHLKGWPITPSLTPRLAWNLIPSLLLPHWMAPGNTFTPQPQLPLP